jgi:YjjG family noncanonical pyrimidine nucleotidase
MVRKQDLKHIFFDLDDTIWDFEKNSERILSKLFEEKDLKNKLQNDFYTYFTAYKKKNGELWQLYNSKKISKDELRKRRFHETFLQFGYDDFDLSWDISEAYIQRSPYGTELKKGSIELLETLGEKYKLHIITNGFKEVQDIKLTQCGLKKYFDAVIISEEIGWNKPNVEIFREAEKLVDAQKEACLMIGDNLDTDIEGAKNAGWQTIWYNPQKSKRSSATQVHCLTEITPHFKN